MTLPRYKGDRAAMRDWLDCKIMAEIEARVASVASTANHEAIADWLKDGWQIEAAERGDMEPLRRLYPRLERFLHPPELRHGEHRKPPPLPKLQVQLAAEFVPFIKEAWRQHYGRRNRSRDDAKAEDIAAEIFNVNPDDVLREIARRAKARGRKQAKAQNPGR